jgi:hypothetical protein
MKRTIILSVAFLFLYLVVSCGGRINGGSAPKVEGGATVGNGGGSENEAERDNPWFLGEGDVQYCIESSEDYPIQRSELETIVRSSFDDWINFFSRSGITKLLFGKDTAGWEFPDHLTRPISLSYKLSTTCPSSGDYVRFLFGIKLPAVDTFLRSTIEPDVGAAIRPPWNHQSYRTGGTVWISSFTHNTSAIKHVVLHEVGHILGMRHGSVFVMLPTMGQHLKNLMASYPDYLGKIEVPVWRRFVSSGDEVDCYDARRGGGSPYDTMNQFGPAQGYLKNTVLPGWLRSGMQLSDDGSHTMKLRYDSLGPPADAQNHFTLSISKWDSTTLKFKGEFGKREWRAELERFLPRVFTTWYQMLPRGPYTWQGPIGFAPEESPVIFAKGSFDIFGKKFPAVIDASGGIRLQICSPDGQQWWELREPYWTQWD